MKVRPRIHERRDSPTQRDECYLDDGVNLQGSQSLRGSQGGSVAVFNVSGPVAALRSRRNSRAVSTTPRADRLGPLRLIHLWPLSTPAVRRRPLKRAAGGHGQRDGGPYIRRDHWARTHPTARYIPKVRTWTSTSRPTSAAPAAWNGQTSTLPMRFTVSLSTPPHCAACATCTMSSFTRCVTSGTCS
jgi:hypothetical protein